MQAGGVEDVVAGADLDGNVFMVFVVVVFQTDRAVCFGREGVQAEVGDVFCEEGEDAWSDGVGGHCGGGEGLGW